MTHYQLLYLFDPLCGWCYGASPVIHALADAPDFHVKLIPTGLFANTGRVMDRAFADYAWQNDQRIAALTGQIFSQHYHDQVLGDDGSPFDSQAVLQGLTAVALFYPDRELQALKILQEARYQAGKNTHSCEHVAAILQTHDFEKAVAQIDSDIARTITASRIQHGQQLMRQYGVQGVPQLIAQTADSKHSGTLLPNQSLFAKPAQAVEQIRQYLKNSEKQ